MGTAQLKVGEVVSLPITLYAAEKGLSGFELIVSVVNEKVAEIVGVELPEFGLDEVGELPAAEVRLGAVDLKDLVSPGEKEAVLAHLKLEGKKPGLTKVELSLIAMDDDQGGAMNPQLISGQLKIG